MKYLSVCSGIEAATVAWHPLGWKPVAFSEIEAFPRAVLAHHYPEVPLHGDFTTIKGDEYGAVDLLVGGTPCQSFSVAGLRKGLDDPRGNLMLEYGALAKRLGAEWLVWENVPGVLSSNGGRDFGAFLGMLVELGYGFAYRVLDAQYFGVPQRRRRVFVVARLGDWRAPAAVLFERHGLQGHPAPRLDAGQAVTGTISSRTTGGGGLGTDFECAGGLQAVAGTLTASYGEQTGQDLMTMQGGLQVEPIAFDCKASGQSGFGVGKVASTMRAMGHADSHNNGGGHLAVCVTGQVTHTLKAEGFDASEDGTGRGQPIITAYDTTQITSRANRSNPAPGDPCHPLAAGAHPPLMVGMAVRRLTPRECERLQGFPDDYTLIDVHAGLLTKAGRPKRKKMAKDGPRYKALSNSMAVPCMRWIGQRIKSVIQLKNEREVA
jgi:DNA (cytosine-5)-methyltransferase 1